ASEYPAAIPVTPSPPVPVPDPVAVPEEAPISRGSRRRTLAIACGLTMLLCFLICGGVLLLNSDWLRKGTGPFAAFSGETSDTKSVEKSNLRMGVLLAEVHETEDVELLLYILAENTSDTRIIHFVENLKWPGKAYEIKLTDEFGNKYHLPTELNHPTLRM